MNDCMWQKAVYIQKFPFHTCQVSFLGSLIPVDPVAGTKLAAHAVCSQDKVSEGQGEDGHSVAQLASRKPTELLPS